MVRFVLVCRSSKSTLRNILLLRYCPKCKNDGNDIVKAGEKLKESKKKAKAPSNVNKNTGRDWGRGMACAGRGKECTIVPSNHFGPIPGVDVGTMWRFRFQVFFFCLFLI